MKYSPQLNLRTSYNFQESLIKIDDYLDFALSNEFKYAFYADLNTMYGAAEFFEKFKKNNIKPIIGVTLEFNLNQHITLNIYAKNRQGYKNISYISSEIMTKNMNDVELINYAKNKFTNDNIFVITFEKENDQQLIDNLFNDIELSNLYYGLNFKNEDSINFENIIYTNKISFIDKKDIKAFNAFLAIKDSRQFDMQNTDDWKDYHYPTDEELYKKIKLSNENLNKISKMINFDLFDENRIHLMKYKTPSNQPQNNFLRNLTLESLSSYFKRYNISQNKWNLYLDRINYELDIIEKMGFVNYFLIVSDYVRWAKNQGIMVGPGRGSAAGSLVSFLLRITTVDPIQYNLLFERFLNPERQTMPDIDIDFQDDRREEVIEYLFEKYGLYKVATIVTYQTIGAKSALRDVFRVFGHDVEFANKVTKLIPLQYQNDLELAIKNSKALTAYYENNKEEFDIAMRLMGMPRQTGTHAAGVILSDVDLREVLPIRIGYNGIMQTQFDMNYLEKLGLIKMDLLGLRNLTTLQEIKKSIMRDNKQNIIFEKLPLNDPKVYETLNEGKTTGVFQLESPGMTNLLVQMQTNDIEDLSTTSAIFRPGPKEMIPDYLKRRKSRKNIDSYIIDPSLTDILGPTFGIILYQEQVIQVLQKVGGLSLGKSDIVRRAMSKKNYVYMESVKDEFISNAIKNGYNNQKALEIWEWIEHFAAYGFNKSHSIAYSYISYWLAWLKTYYPEQFYASLFNSALGNAKKTSILINEIQAYGIDFKGPNIKNVNSNYVSYNKMIFAPLTIVKGIGPEFVRKIRDLYKADKKPFDNIFTLLTVLNGNGLTQGTLEALIWSGALDTYGYSRQALGDNIDLLLTAAETYRKNEKIDLDLAPIIETDSPIDEKIIYENEQYYLGFYLTTNPFTKLRKEYTSEGVMTLDKIKNNTGFGKAIFIVNSIRTKKDKNGNLMAFLEIADDTEIMRATMFSRTYEEIKDKLIIGDLMIGLVKVETYNDSKSAIINQVIKFIRK